jgi:hypothetical protein
MIERLFLDGVPVNPATVHRRHEAIHDLEIQAGPPCSGSGSLHGFDRTFPPQSIGVARRTSHPKSGHEPTRPGGQGATQAASSRAPTMMRCRIKPYLIKAAPRGAAGPVSAPGLWPWEAPPRRTPGHAPQGTQI